MNSTCLVINNKGYHLSYTTIDENGKLCCLNDPIVCAMPKELLDTLELVSESYIKHDLKARQLCIEKIANIVGADIKFFSIKVEDSTLIDW